MNQFPSKMMISRKLPSGAFIALIHKQFSGFWTCQTVPQDLAQNDQSPLSNYSIGALPFDLRIN
jgi:hypothetical protein